MAFSDVAKPLAFIVVYVAFAAAVRSVLKRVLPSFANWGFLILLVLGFVVLYYVYYEAFYFAQEILLPSWTGGGPNADADELGGLLQPALYGLALLFFASSYFEYLQNGGQSFDFYPPLFLGLLFLGGGVATTFFDEETED